MSLDVNPFVEVYAADDWQDATGDVFTADGTEAINITTGNQGMNAVLGEPSQMTLTFLSWDWWPDNAAGPYHGYLDINTPIRAGVGLVDHAFPGTVVDGWSDVGGLPVTNSGVGGVVAASDFQQTPGVGTHSVPGAGQYRTSVVEDQDQGDGEQYVEFRLPTANVTGAGFEPANLISGWLAGDSEYIMLRLVVLPDESITLKFMYVNETTPIDFDITDEATATLTNSGQWIAVKTNLEQTRMQAKVWAAGDPEPLEWAVDQEGDWVTYSGGIGIRTGIETGNTNASPKVVEYRNWRFRSLQFYGGISEYAPEPVQTAEGDVQIPIVANGPSRRFAQGQLPVVSALGRAIPGVPGLVALWPCEDAAGSTEFASALPNHLPMVVRRGSPDFASFSELDSTRPLVSTNEADWIGDVLPYTHTGQIQLRCIIQPPSTPLPDLTILIRLYTFQPGCILWQLVYRTASGGSLEVQAWRSETESVYGNTTGETGLDGVARMFSLELEQNGADVDVHTSQFPFILADPGSDTDDTATGLTLASVKQVWVNPQLRDNIVFGFIHIQNERTPLNDILTQMLSNAGERQDARLERILTENGIAFSKYALRGEFMGPQQPENMVNIIEECLELDSGGVFYDGKTHDGCVFVSRQDMHNKTDHVAVDYAQLFDTFRPRRDDRDPRNKITVTRDGGSSATYALETGRRSVLPPQDGGIGEYPSSVTVNKYDDDGLVHIAAWRVHSSTVDEPRYTEATIECSSPEVTATPEVRRRLLDLRPGHILSVANAEKIRAYSTIVQRVAGHSQEITQFRHSFTMNTVPATPYNRLFTPANTDLSDGEYARADSKYSTLVNAITDAATSFTVVSTGWILWVNSTDHAGHFPFNITVGGEEMTVTAITPIVPAYIITGTAAHADNTSVSPGVPGGATAAGDDMLMFTRGRAQAANDPASWSGGTGTGWTLVLTSGTFKLFRKTHTGSESAPTVTWPAGAAGDVNTAVTTAWSDLGDLIASIGTSVGGGGSQNMPYLGLSGTVADGVALFAGAKADDWTGVATITGATEIVDTSTTVGNDHGLVVDYMTHNGSATGTPVLRTVAGEFVVTGGVAAPNRTLVTIFGHQQTFTVTRGPNARAHVAGLPVRLAVPNRAAL